MADGYNVAAGGLSGLTSGALMGAAAGSVIPGLGTLTGGVIGGALGAISGGLLGGSKKKYKKPARASGSVYGYDMNGNLANKSSFAYNSATGQYELKAGELSQEEKQMRQNLSYNIGNLINTVGSTPDAFVRYAKELSDSYYRQGETRLTEQYEKAQARLDENLARRGLSTSRAAADITGELQGQRLDTLADIYDTAQRYGLSAQLQMAQDARSALATIGGYQGQLQSADQAYLTQALNAQQAGQAVENARVGASNANIAMQNASIDNMLGTMSQLGSLAGYYLGSQAAQPSSTGSTNWMTQGTNAAIVAGPAGFGTIDYSSAMPTVNTGLSAIYPNLVGDKRLSL